MITFSTKTIVAATAGVTVLAAGVTTALAHDAAPNPASVKAAPADAAPAAPADPPAAQGKIVKKHLPEGVSTATSFWDPATASGRPMSYHTIASPYWPLGTTVKVTYQGRSVQGVVEDFGPAEWAVAQHNPPALVDLSEKMMRDLTGQASNSVTVKFEVVKLGKGDVYRHSGTGYDEATGT
jgi:hypothetical protein